MTKSELISFVARRHHQLPAADMELAVNLIITTLSEALANADRIEVRGFGAFSLHHIKPRIGRNPKTGESVKVPGRRSIHFKPGKELKESVNNV
jgi:integration host factor subunit beta